MCKYSDHEAGQMQHLGDALGRDCVVECFVKNKKGCWATAYQNDGLKNEDWFGWYAEVLSPVNGVVKGVYDNPVENTPGIMTPGRASSIVIQTGDGTNIVLAHTREALVNENDTVVQGQIIAKVGNNGYSRSPHIHIGAWKDNEPLAIEFDRKLMADVKNKAGIKHWLFGTHADSFDFD
jgi:hypothetical protein